jgi:predicted amidophosphoribosyltransferase
VPARDTLRALVDLVLPATCAGCGTAGGQLCPRCTAGLAGLVPGPARPTPAPDALPPCVALGAYEGPLRGLIIAYKERGAHPLARPLGTHLGRAAGLAARRSDAVSVALVPVPATAAAIRDRHGDHVLRLARHAARGLRSDGYPVTIVSALAARPKADSSGLGAAARAESAAHAFRVRPVGVRRLMAAQRAGATVIVLDDILTTGSTLAAVTIALADSGVPVASAATVAATRRRGKSPDRGRRPGTRSDVAIST